MMASDCSSRSKEVCQICRQETSYRCLQCAKPVCNRSKSCSVAASEEEPGWKPRHAVHRYAFHVQIQSLNLASTNGQLYQREAILQRQRRNKHQMEAILQRQRRNKHALQRPKRSVNVLIFRRKLKSSNLQRKTLTLDQGN